MTQKSFFEFLLRKSPSDVLKNLPAESADNSPEDARAKSAAEILCKEFLKLVNALLAACNEHSAPNLQLKADKSCVIPLPKRNRKIGNAGGRSAIGARLSNSPPMCLRRLALAK